MYIKGNICIDGEHLERAIERFWFTKPEGARKPFNKLTPTEQDSIFGLALQIMRRGD